MSTPNYSFYISSDIAGVAILGSVMMYRKILSLEQQIEEKNNQFNQLISEIQSRTSSLEKND